MLSMALWLATNDLHLIIICSCPSGHVLWSSKGITVTDLEDLKLIGICRHEKKSVDRMIPKSVQVNIRR